MAQADPLWCQSTHSMATRSPSRKHSLVAQKLRLEQLFPDSDATVRADKLTWRGQLKPTPASRVYTAALSYKRREFPRVRIVHPVLETRGGSLPHVYIEGHLCLFLPSAYEWDASMFLADTIIPWAAEWLLFYEIWLATGEWLGGGAHPQPGRGKQEHGRRESQPHRGPRKRGKAKSG